MALSPKQRAFVDHYLQCWNATEAARRADYKSPNVQGPRLLVKVGIQAHIEKRLKELKLGADEVLVRLGEHARGNIGDFIAIRPDGGFSVDMKRAEEARKLGLIKKIKKTTRTVRGETEETIEFEMYDAQSALNTLAKHHGLLRERIEVDYRIELQQLGLDPEDIENELVDQFVEHIRKGEERASSGSMEESEADRRDSATDRA